MHDVQAFDGSRDQNDRRAVSCGKLCNCPAYAPGRSDNDNGGSW
ncbi:hypothetical protein N182_17145 [Sinorhizobium sp. GL2]|nr:hypothetical protein N182_17145 [Sinorhizobium sp. GL2]